MHKVYKLCVLLLLYYLMMKILGILIRHNLPDGSESNWSTFKRLIIEHFRRKITQRQFYNQKLSNRKVNIYFLTDPQLCKISPTFIIFPAYILNPRIFNTKLNCFRRFLYILIRFGWVITFDIYLRVKV